MSDLGTVPTSGLEAVPTPGVEAAPEPASVVVRYWAGARHAAGVESDVVVAATVGEALDAALALHAELAPVLVLSTVLVDGEAGSADERHRPLPAGGVIEVLPPFAGG